MIRLDMENYNTILTEKLQKHQHYHLEKLINVNILQKREILNFDQRRLIEQAKFANSALRKALKKQTKTVQDQGGKQIKAIEKHGKQLKQLVESNTVLKNTIMIMEKIAKHI